MPVFLLGAGFNYDAKQAAGKIIGHSAYGAYEMKCRYPLVTDLLGPCFGKDNLREGETIEELFAAAIQERNYKPLEALSDALMHADSYIARQLSSADANPDNCYARFFERIRGCHFLTFNYDSLPEILLFQRGDWYPHDGYGVAVEVKISSRISNEYRSKKSKSLVLHLHGSFCIYPNSFDLVTRPGDITQWIVEKSEPSYIFDPHSITHRFSPYERMPPEPTGYEYVAHRVIAPVPDKAEGLQKVFIQAMHTRAREILRSTNEIIAIGYRFNPLDHVSYEPLLSGLSHSKRARVVLVCPDAELVRDQLSVTYSHIEWIAVPTTFKRWVDAGFPEAGS